MRALPVVLLIFCIGLAACSEKKEAPRDRVDAWPIPISLEEEGRKISEQREVQDELKKYLAILREEQGPETSNRKSEETPAWATAVRGGRTKVERHDKTCKLLDRYDTAQVLKDIVRGDATIVGKDGDVADMEKLIRAAEIAAVRELYGVIFSPFPGECNIAVISLNDPFSVYEYLEKVLREIPLKLDDKEVGGSAEKIRAYLLRVARQEMPSLRERLKEGSEYAPERIRKFLSEYNFSPQELGGLTTEEVRMVSVLNR